MIQKPRWASLLEVTKLAARAEGAKHGVVVASELQPLLLVLDHPEQLLHLTGQALQQHLLDVDTALVLVIVLVTVLIFLVVLLFVLVFIVTTSFGSLPTTSAPPTTIVVILVVV